MSLTRLAVVRPLTVLMGLLGLVIMGGVAYTFLKVDRLPPISIPFVSVGVSYPGATAQDVEQLITIPVENAVSGMSGVSSITSTSSEGSSSVNVQVANDQFVPQLQSVPGVATVNISGGLQREVQVRVDYAKLAAYGITVQQLSTAMTNANVNAPVGSLQQGASTLNVRSLGAFKSV